MELGQITPGVSRRCGRESRRSEEEAPFRSGSLIEYDRACESPSHIRLVLWFAPNAAQCDDCRFIVHTAMLRVNKTYLATRTKSQTPRRHVPT